jgi:hypothetical protein
MIPRLLAGPVLAAAMLFTSGVAAAQCFAESGERRVPLLELYTSEGCNSCPPADRWVSALPGRGLTHERVVALAFHVDYWNYLGWTDPFSKADYSERQRAASQRNRARFVYTPQLLLNGKDYRRGALRDEFAERVHALNADAARARISLKLATKSADELSVQGSVFVPDATQRHAARAYLALYQNNLENHVTAGENRGKRLRHDFVVRDLAGPYSLDSQGALAFSYRFGLAPGWNTGDLHVAAFVQDQFSGDVLQALALPYCH